VVELVLEDARLQARRLDPHWLPLDVKPAQRGVQRPLDVHRHARQA
jgi:hypothetical protein